MDNGIQPNPNGIQPNPYGMQPVNFPKYTKYLILSIFQTFCCNQITGIIALILTVMSNSAFRIGNFADYEYKVKIAKVTLIAGWIITLIIWILAILWCILVFYLEQNS